MIEMIPMIAAAADPAADATAADSDWFLMAFTEVFKPVVVATASTSQLVRSEPNTASTTMVDPPSESITLVPLPLPTARQN